MPSSSGMVVCGNTSGNEIELIVAFALDSNNDAVVDDDANDESFVFISSFPVLC